jgi:hypothetical protein
MTKNRHLDEKMTPPHTLKNFSTHKIHHLIVPNHSKISKTRQEPKNTKKMTIFDPFSDTPKNSHF